MVLGSHVIFSTYGFWLPNDPRGSWSDFVGSWELFRHGRATKTTETRSVARRQHDVAVRLAARTALQYPAVQMNGVQARAAVRGFGDYVRRSGLVVRACVIMPDHVHLVVQRFRLSVEKVVSQLKAAASRQLLKEKIHPFQGLRDQKKRVPRCWTRGEWKVFLDCEDDFARAIAYVENNPVKEGKRPQTWSFVQRKIV